MKKKKLQAFVAALLLSMSSLFVLVVPHAFAATKTWDGGGGDANMTTAANWAGDSAPTAGDDLVFPANLATADRLITNDFTAATSFNSITFSGAASSASNYTISGNSMTLVAGINNSMTGSSEKSHRLDLNLILNGTQTFQTTDLLDFNGTLNLGSSALTVSVPATQLIFIDGVVSGTGSITKTGTGDLLLSASNTFSGAVAVSAGTLVGGEVTSLGTAAAGTTVASGAALYLYKSAGDVTYTEPLTLAGTGTATSPTLTVTTGYLSGGAVSPPYPLSTFSGTITLQSDIIVSAAQRNLKITGSLTGSFAISVSGSSSGTLEVAASSNTSNTPNGTYSAAAKETKYEANSPSTPITVNANETAIVTGTYGDVTVSPLGTLKGTGTVGAVTVYDGATIAPGLSPGCLNTGNITFQDGSTYEFELGGTVVCTQYDQITVTGTVNAGGTLEISLYNNFKPLAGQKYVIVSNDGSDAVSSTFDGLAEGATITLGSYSFKISYVGGDGNDIELTTLVGAPATGFSLIKNNPILTMAVVTVTAAGLLFVSRRFKRATVTVRK